MCKYTWRLSAATMPLYVLVVKSPDGFGVNELVIERRHYVPIGIHSSAFSHTNVKQVMRLVITNVRYQLGIYTV